MPPKRSNRAMRASEASGDEAFEPLVPTHREANPGDPPLRRSERARRPPKRFAEEYIDKDEDTNPSVPAYRKSNATALTRHSGRSQPARKRLLSPKGEVINSPVPSHWTPNTANEELFKRTVFNPASTLPYTFRIQCTTYSDSGQFSKEDFDDVIFDNPARANMRAKEVAMSVGHPGEVVRLVKEQVNGVRGLHEYEVSKPKNQEQVVVRVSVLPVDKEVRVVEHSYFDGGSIGRGWHFPEGEGREE